ncbi:MAG: hypothetical protein JXA36_03925 [Coriobacteriia bacterium]|nr:hypothetical protein [Coriobacteriia bacterium]
MSLSPDELRSLKEDLRSDDPTVREAAVERASEVIDSTVMRVISEALLSDNPEVRQRAVELFDKLQAGIGSE